MSIDRDRLRTAPPQPRPRWQSPPPLAVRPPVVSSPDITTSSKPQPIESQRPQSESGTNVTINIKMPKFTRPHLPKLPYRRIGIAFGVVAGLIIISLIAHHYIAIAVNNHREYQRLHQVNTVLQQRTKPSYAPLVPSSGSSATSKTAAYDSTRNSYSYSDTLKGNAVLVSQQPISSVSAVTSLSKIARTLNANTVITTGASKAYLASDKVTGAQTIVFIKDNLLVFVQSAFAHTNDDWQSYLSGLST